MKKLTASFLIVVLLYIGQLTSATYALSCVEPDLPHIAFNNYDAVIIGQVISVKERMNDKLIKVEVKKSFKGVTAKNIKIFEDFTWGESSEGNTYLYFLKQEKQGWINPLCSPSTSDISLADQYLADKAELPLDDNKPSNIVQVAIITLAIVIVSIIVLSTIIRYKKRRNINRG